MLLDRVTTSAATARAARSALVSGVVVACATLAHVGAGGAVGAEAVAGLAAVSTLVALVLTGRRLTTGQLLGLLVLGQVGLHVLGTPAGSHDAAMALSHAAATLASLLVLRHGEDLWWSATERVVAVLRVRAVAPARPSARPVVSVPATPGGRTAWRAVQGRAPPGVA